jgi:HicB family
MAENKKHKNLTLRLPDDFHEQLSRQAGQRALTLNALLLNIVQRHLMDSGFAPTAMKSMSGRLFEIKTEPLPQITNEYFSSRFDLMEYHPLFTKRRAYYIFGVASQLTNNVDPFGTVKDVGLALLNFYNRKGLELDQLAWQTNESEPSSPSSEIQDNWRYIGTSITTNVSSFMISLARDYWKDDRLVITGQSQDIRLQP